MTHRLYKDEYSTELLYQIQHNGIEGIVALESTDKVLTVSGELEDLQKLSSLMYTYEEDKIKSVFPSFKTKKGLEENIQHSYNMVFLDVQTKILAIIRECASATYAPYEESEQYKLMTEMYDKMCELESKRK